MRQFVMPVLLLTVSAFSALMPAVNAQEPLNMRVGSLDSAVAAVRANPNNLSLRRNLAVALIRKGLTVKAVEQLRGVLALEAPNADDTILLGDAYRYSGDNQNAVRCYKTALCLQPMSSKARCGLALSYASVGDLKSGYDICQNGLAQLVDPFDRQELQKTLAALQEMYSSKVATAAVPTAY